LFTLSSLIIKGSNILSKTDSLCPVVSLWLLRPVPLRFYNYLRTTITASESCLRFTNNYLKLGVANGATCSLKVTIASVIVGTYIISERLANHPSISILTFICTYGSLICSILINAYSSISRYIMLYRFSKEFNT
jgi:hypothetical protein